MSKQSLIATPHDPFQYRAINTFHSLDLKEKEKRKLVVIYAQLEFYCVQNCCAIT
jgi:hypothetical protein